MNISTDHRPKDWTDWLLSYYKFSRSINLPEIITFGLIFYGLSIFLNRPSSVNGLFGTMEQMTGIMSEAWAVIIVLAVVVIRTSFNVVVQLAATIVLIIVMSFMWWVVWRAGFAWQGVITFSLCVLVCVKASTDDLLAHILVQQGKL